MEERVGGREGEEEEWEKGGMRERKKGQGEEG